MADIVELRKDLELVNNYQQLAKSYGLFSLKKTVAQPGGEAKEYLIFSLSPIPADVNPVAIINRNERNANIFYPDSFAVELHSGNPLLIWEGISNYLGYAEFIFEVYEEFHTPLPKAIRVDELEAIANFYCKMTNPKFDDETKMDYRKGLQDFFKEENPKSKFKKEWLEFYRSELFDPDKSFVQNFIAFLKRNEPETSLDTLIDSNGELKKVYMPEHHYKEFREIIKKRYPDVKYSVGDKHVVDNGVIIDPDSGEAVDTPYGKTVTQEEYDRIREERFAVEGYACLDGLTPSYFEGRDIVYKACDENIIASVSHEISYRWAKCSNLESLKQKGALSCEDIPSGHMMNFYAEVQAAGIPIYLDFDVNNNPNFGTVRVVFNSDYQDTIRALLVGLTMAQVSLAHVSLNNKDVMFDVDVKKVDVLLQQARARAITGTADNIPMIENSGKVVDDNPSLG